MLLIGIELIGDAATSPILLIGTAFNAAGATCTLDTSIAAAVLAVNIELMGIELIGEPPTTILLMGIELMGIAWKSMELIGMFAMGAPRNSDSIVVVDPVDRISDSSW
ncbi:MAG: hypothetical protein KC482_11130 [Dehalococcoidia bacterium]|nr:hypothetical protein [Dehalococcoidia bacterium]